MISTNEIKNNDNSTIKLKRVICIVPSLTELLHYFGLDDEVVGITKFCVHPQAWFRQKKRVGGTKRIRRDAIRELSPDLIIANKEENTKEDLEGWEDILVWVTEIKQMDDLFDVIESIGHLFNKKKKADQLIRTIEDKQKKYTLQKSIVFHPKVIYLIWWDPIMTVGGDTFIHHMMDQAGLTNVCKDLNRYPIVTFNQMKAYAPDFIFLSSEPFRFKEKHRQILQDKIPTATIIDVDGEMFSWYGSRVCQSFDYFQEELMPKMTQL